MMQIILPTACRLFVATANRLVAGLAVCSFTVSSLAVSGLAVTAAAQDGPPDSPAPPMTTPAPADAYLYIGYPNDAQVVRADHPIRVWFGLRNMGVAPKGVSFPNSGHHHLLIDTDLPPLDHEIPSDRNHLHFGAGETETVIVLPPGRHTLQLLMGDARHLPHAPPVMSRKISIVVR